MLEGLTGILHFAGMQQLGSQQSIKRGSGRSQAQPPKEGQVESQIVAHQLDLFQSRSEWGKSRGRIGSVSDTRSGEGEQVDDGNGPVREGEGEQPEPIRVRIEAGSLDVQGQPVHPLQPTGEVSHPLRRGDPLRPVRPVRAGHENRRGESVGKSDL